MSDEAGGRIFFSSVGRSLEEEDEVRLLSVGVDIGSSTSHLVFSRLVLERLDTRYIVAERTVLHESEVLLTPYHADGSIDAETLGSFIEGQYARAGIEPEAIDTGALILTGVAVRRSNARAIADLFAKQAGKFVSVSAGDALEATLAAFGSGAVARSAREGCRVLNIDIGGGTSKFAVCDDGVVTEQTAADIGARVVSFDAEGRVARVEEAGRRFADEAGTTFEVGSRPDAEALRAVVSRMADRLFEVAGGASLSDATAALLRLPPLRNERAPDVVTFSGGVAEYIYGREGTAFGDLGPDLAHAIRQRVRAWGPRVEVSAQAIRATVVGASQYTIQLSGSTIFVAPDDALPLRNLPVVAPDLPLDEDVIAPGLVADAVRRSLRRLDLDDGTRAVAVFYRFRGSATFARLDALVEGLALGLARVLEGGWPLVLVGDGDVGGVVGIHCREEARLPNPVVSVDGITLAEFDYIDIGALLPTSGAVPVVIKSLVFPGSSALGRPNGGLTRRNWSDQGATP